MSQSRCGSERELPNEALLLSSECGGWRLQQSFALCGDQPPRYLTAMPVISRFLGIVVAILYRDPDPPHFTLPTGSTRSPSGSATVWLQVGSRAARWFTCWSGSTCIGTS